MVTWVHIKQGEEKNVRLDAGQYIYHSKGTFIAEGSTAIIERLPSGNVMKTPSTDPHDVRAERDNRKSLCLEAQIYQKLGTNPRIPKLIEWCPDTCCLILEWLENGNLKTYMMRNSSTIKEEIRLKWAKQAAEAVQAVHSADVVHCDISPRNFLVDSQLDLKISDFGGASLSGSKPSAYADTRYRPANASDPDLQPGFNEDIFALGSLLYFIMTGTDPYEEVPSDKVKTAYKMENFPDVSHLKYGSVIEQCWVGGLQIDQVCNQLSLHRNDNL